MPHPAVVVAAAPAPPATAHVLAAGHAPANRAGVGRPPGLSAGRHHQGIADRRARTSRPGGWRASWSRTPGRLVVREKAVPPTTWPLSGPGRRWAAPLLVVLLLRSSPPTSQSRDAAARGGRTGGGPATCGGGRDRGSRGVPVAASRSWLGQDLPPPAPADRRPAASSTATCGWHVGVDVPRSRVAADPRRGRLVGQAAMSHARPLGAPTPCRPSAGPAPPSAAVRPRPARPTLRGRCITWL